jgi:spore cortex formation protein SpoVR/YcgB (stage V sporulation)
MSLVSIPQTKSVNSIEVLKALNFELKARIVGLMAMMKLMCVKGFLMMEKTKELEDHQYLFLINFEEQAEVLVGMIIDEVNREEIREFQVLRFQVKVKVKIQLENMALKVFEVLIVQIEEEENVE